MELRFDIYDKNNFKEYYIFLNQHLIEIDIYYQTHFLSIDAQIQQGEYEIIVISHQNNVLIYPYIKLKIPFQEYSNFYDISSPYGYAGPYTNTSNNEFLILAEEKITHYLLGNNVVTEFVRYHYLYNKDYQFKQNITNVFNRNIVTLQCAINTEEVWKNQFSVKCRNLFKKLENEKFEFEFTNSVNDINIFYDLYIKTMDNAKADDFYYFKKSSIDDTFSQLGNDVVLCKILRDKIIYASAIFFIKNKIATYYLSARNINYPKVTANNFLLAKFILWATHNGYTTINIGGGTDAREDNSLLLFKKNFSKNIEPFFIGKRVHNTVIYNELKLKYQALFGIEQYNNKKNILQFYR